MNSQKSTNYIKWLSIALGMFFLSACGSGGGSNNTSDPETFPANLTALSVTDQTLTPTFASTVTSYAVSVTNSVSSITINATAANPGVVTVDAAIFSASGNFDVTVGDNVFAIKVTTTTESKTYTLTVTRDAPAIPVVSGGRAILGPISEGNYKIYDIGDLTTVIATGTTSGGTNISEIGLIDTGSMTFTDTQAYLVTITGGEDVDVNDDSVLDTPASPLRGTIHAVLSGATLNGSEVWKVTVLSEFAYQNIKLLLANGSSSTEILAALDEVATELINADISGDSTIDATDLALWDPVVNTDQSIVSLAKRTFLNLLILNGGTVSNEYIELAGELGSYPNNINDSNGAADIATVADTAYVVTGYSCYIVKADMADVSDPQMIEEFLVPNCNDGLTGIRGFSGALYTTDQYGSLYTYDKDSLSLLSSYYYDRNSDSNPVVIDGVTYAGITPRIRHDTPIISNYAFIPTYTFDPNASFYQQVQGMMVLDLSDTSAFSPVAMVLPTTSFKGNCEIDANGNRAYMLCGGELMTIDISSPTAPVVLSTVSTPLPASRMKISADGLYLYVTGNGTFFTLNLADNTVASEINLSGNSVRSYLEQRGDLIYLSTVVGGGITGPENIGIEVINVADPQALMKNDVIDVPKTTYITSMTEYNGNLLIGGNADAGQLFRVWSTSTKKSLVGVSGTITGDINAIELSGKFARTSNNYLYASVDGTTFQIYDISDPSSPATLGSFAVPETYVVNYGSGDFEQQNGIMAIKAAGDNVYVQTVAGIHTISVADPMSPQESSYLDQASNLYGGRGPLAITANESFDVLYHSSLSYNNGSTQTQVGTIDQGMITDGNSISTSGALKGLVANEKSPGFDRIYLYHSGNGGSRVYSYNVDSQAAQFQTSAAGTSPQITYVLGIDAQADTVFTISPTELNILDASNDVFAEGGRTTYAMGGNDIKIDGNRAFLSSGGTGLHILDITDTSSVVVSMQINTQGSTKSAVFNDSFVAFHELGAGVHLIKNIIQEVP